MLRRLGYRVQVSRDARAAVADKQNVVEELGASIGRILNDRSDR